jgi:predicted amidophosphoribosyltransferase
MVHETASRILCSNRVTDSEFKKEQENALLDEMNRLLASAADLKAAGSKFHDRRQFPIFEGENAFCVQIPQRNVAEKFCLVLLKSAGGGDSAVERSIYGDLRAAARRISPDVALLANLMAGDQHGHVADAGAATGYVSEPNPIALFLERSLPQKAAMRSRNEASYVSVRTWRSSIKEHQIEALRALKRAPPPDFVDQIVSELVSAIDKLIGRDTFDVVVPMPCGSSGTHRCLSARLAERLSQVIGKPMVSALSAELRAGSSHPKNNASRPRMQVEQTLTESILLVDDVVTSGDHIEEALSLLRKSSSSAFAIAWIGGETK